MNEKTTRQIEEMKKQTIGVEIEMNSITRDKAAKIAATYFGTGRFQNTASRNGYYTWSAWDSCSTAATVCSLLMSHLCAADSATSASAAMPLFCTLKHVDISHFH